jgi:hypothetical protein
MDRLMESSVKAAMLEWPGAFTAGAFQKTFGCPIENLKTVLTAVIPKEKSEEPAFFSILRFEKPLDRAQLTKVLKLVPQPAINGIEWFTVMGDLDSLSASFVRFASPSPEKFSLHILDDQTLVFADAGPMRTFLEENRAPKRLTLPPPPSPEAIGGGLPGTPGAAPGNAPPTSAGGAIKPNSPPPAGGPPRNSAEGAPGGPSLFQEPPVAPKPGPGSVPRTVAPTPTTPPPAPEGAASGAVEADPTGSNSYMTVDPSLKIAMDRLEQDKLPTVLYVGVVIHQLNLVPRDALTDTALDRSQVERYVPAGSETPDGPRVVAFSLHDFTEIRIAGMVVLQSEKAESARIGKTVIDNVAETIGRLFKTALEMDVSVTKAANTSPQPIGPARTPQFQRNLNRNAAPAAPGAPLAATGKDGTITTWYRDKTIAVTVDLSLNGRRDIYVPIRDAFRAEMVQLKGQAELVATRLRIHELARALQAYAKEHAGALPRGAVQRAPNAERGIDWYPDQRLSWMVELLPYLGDGEFKDLIRDKDKSWIEADNRLTAQVVIPQFLAPGDPKYARVRYPGKLGRYAATRFIAVAGLGLDAGSYPSGNLALSKKLGAFGYDRVTKPDDIRDDLDSTILLLQIPGGQITPWMAGGGSTVRGISEGDDAVKPFVCTEYKGKKGTFAVMGDFKVRFIPEDIKPSTFRAMCTIAGGEPIDDINTIAEVVPEEAISELKAAPLAGGPPVPGAKSELTASSNPAGAASKPALAAGWKEIVDDVAGYAVALPDGNGIDLPATQIPGVVGSKGSGIVARDGTKYVVWYFKLSAAIQPNEANKFFEDLRGKMLKDDKVSSEKPIQLEGCTGIEWNAESAAAGGRSIQRCYVNKDQAYFLLAGGPKMDPKEVETFFNSFRLVKK